MQDSMSRWLALVVLLAAMRAASESSSLPPQRPPSPFRERGFGARWRTRRRAAVPAARR
jgi:hypothetical protein